PPSNYYALSLHDALPILNVSCEVTPHHLLLTEDDIKQDDTNYKMNPPLRSKADQEALLLGILDHTIDIIATDHAPHTIQDKAGGDRKSTRLNSSHVSISD